MCWIWRSIAMLCAGMVLGLSAPAPAFADHHDRVAGKGERNSVCCRPKGHRFDYTRAKTCRAHRGAVVSNGHCRNARGRRSDHDVCCKRPRRDRDMTRGACIENGGRVLSSKRCSVFHKSKSVCCRSNGVTFRSALRHCRRVHGRVVSDRRCRGFHSNHRVCCHRHGRTFRTNALRCLERHGHIVHNSRCRGHFGHRVCCKKGHKRFFASSRGHCHRRGGHPISSFHCR